ncbi:MAG TPA: hypothetical protein VHS58_06155 [Acetobacteraceae bacterium]|nr:hypothetical protein [Acetobacteraceae bacterium]
MTQDEHGGLTFETLLSDPLIRLVMASDGVTIRDLIAALEVVEAANATTQDGAPLWSRRVCGHA